MSNGIKQLSGAALVTALLIALPVQAADKPRISAYTDIKPVATLTAGESQALSLAAGRILLHTDKARLAIVKKNKKAALDEINQGLALVEVIENALPKYKVTTKIEAGDASYSSEEAVSKRFVTVFDEQYVEDVIAPVVLAKKAAHGSAKSGQGKHAVKKAMKSAPAAVEEFSEWRRSTMRLNVVLAGDALELAKAELGKDKNDNADSALLLIQSTGVTFEFDEVELPLIEAADNLKLAELEISEGKSAEARMTLKLASDDLKKYEQIAGESRAKEVRELHQKIDKLTATLEKGNSAGALEKAKKEIASYWEHVVTWFK